MIKFHPPEDEETGRNPQAASSDVADAASDAELMTGVRGADERAFEILLRRHQDRVFRLALRTLGDAQEAQEVAQEVFIGIWDNPRAWRPQARFTTWLYRITINRALNRLRAKRLRNWLPFSNLTSADEPVAPHQENPDQLSIRRDEGRLIQKAFDSLPARQKAALHLHCREGVSVVEVARSLGVSFKSAESLIFRGKRALREQLEGRPNRGKR